MDSGQVYFINKSDKILYAEKNWNGFAMENLSEVSDKKIEGQSIWNFISQRQVQKLYKELFDAVRNNGKSVSLDFRCDSDKVIRYMQMSIEPLENQVIKVRTSTIKEVPRNRILSSPILYIGINQALPMCSSCNKVFIAKKGDWLEIDKALELDLIPDPLNVKFDLCTYCVHYLEEKIVELKC